MMRQPVRKKNRVTLGEAIEAFLHQFKLNEGVHEVRIQNNWELWMGKTIARYTREISVRKKTLFIRVESSPLKQELLFMRENIIKRVNDECKEEVIREVVIQ